MSAGDGRSSRAGHDEVSKPPLYARALRLKYIRPGPWWCFLFFEGSLVLAGVLVLTDWVSPWGLLVVPVGVAIAVKLNDVVTGALPSPGAGAAQARTTTAAETTSQLYSEADADCTWPARDATATGDEWATGNEANADDDGEATALVEADHGEANESESAGHSTMDSRDNQTAQEDPVDDPATSDHLSGDRASGDPASGDPASGGPASGGPASSGPASADSASGGPPSGDTATGDDVSGGSASGGWASGEDMSGSSVLDDSSADNPLADKPEEHNAAERTSTVGSRDGNA